MASFGCPRNGSSYGDELQRCLQHDLRSRNYVGGCQNSDLFLGTIKNLRCHIILGIQKGTIILTTTHVKAQKKGTSTRKYHTRLSSYRMSFEYDHDC